MFGFLKNLMGNREVAPAASAEPPVPPANAKGPNDGPHGSQGSQAAASPGPAVHKGGQPPGERSMAGGAGASAGKVGAGGRILISLKAVTDGLPPELAGLLAGVPPESAKISLSLEEVVSQLPRGRVEIAFARLRQLVPEGTFGGEAAAGGAFDEARVEIPLGEVLARIDPALLKTTPRQRLVVPGDIEDPFKKQASRTTPIPPPEDAGKETLLRMPTEVQTVFQKKEEPAPAPVVAPVAAVPAPAAAPEPAPTKTATVEVPLSAVVGTWPEAIQEEVAGMPDGARIVCPRGELEPLLRQGKVAIRWATLRDWVQPALPVKGESLYDDAIVELPLAVVAPLFMAGAGAMPRPAARRLEVDESVPAPFKPAAPVELRQAAPPRPVEKPAPAPTPAPTAQSAPLSTPEPPPAPVKPPEPVSQGGSLGLDDRVPKDLVRRACALPGVAGAVITLNDGLLVAATLPEGFTAETIAAFLPQVFSRLEQAAGTMQIGEVQHLMFTAGNRPWQMWRAGTLFFAAIGEVNGLLPGAQLKIIAAQLARQTGTGT